MNVGAGCYMIRVDREAGARLAGTENKKFRPHGLKTNGMGGEYPSLSQHALRAGPAQREKLSGRE